MEQSSFQFRLTVESQTKVQKAYSRTTTEAGQSDFLESQDIYDQFSNEQSQIPLNANQQSLRVINSAFVFGSLMLPYFMQSVGIIIGSIIFFLIFLISFYQSITLLEIKSELQKQHGICSVTEVITLCGYSQTISTIFRIIFIINSLIYLMLLLEVFAFSINYIILLFTDVTKWYNSTRFFVIIGGLLAIPLNFKQTYPAQITAISRGFVLFAILMVVIIGGIINTQNQTNMHIYLPINFSTEIFLSTLPSILISLAYHQQYFSGIVGENNQQMKIGSFQGALIIMILELIVAIIGQIAFYNYFSPQYNNILILTSNSQYNLAAGIQALFYTVISVSAFLQITQYVPQCSQQIKNVLKQLDEQNQLVINTRIIKVIPIVITIIVTVISISLCSISFLVVLMGTITQNALSLQLPSVLFLKKSIDQQNKNWEAIMKIIFSASILFFSLFFGSICLFAGIFEYIQYSNN